MSRGTFLVGMREEYWSICYSEQWYGRYPDLKTAQEATIAIAKAHGEVPTRVIVQNPDGTELLVWESSTSPTSLQLTSTSSTMT
jgi:hypothetical protein